MTETVQPKKKRINSREKGKRGERAWRDELRSAGFLKSYRGQQFSGTESTADVICPELPNFYFEVKAVEKLNVYDAIHQGVRCAGDKTVIVAHKRNHGDWLVTMRAQDWFCFVKDAGYAVTVFCPDCGASDVTRNGYGKKLKPVYLCNNSDCKRTSFTKET